MWGVKQNNLKNIEVKIPLGQTTVICGPSGSGKSSLAFETLFAEGQRRFIESMSTYARQFLNKAPKPDIEGVENIPPAISIEQKNSVKSSRSTVGTTTEVVDYLRLFFEKVGVSHCPDHDLPLKRTSITEAADLIFQNLDKQRGYLLVKADVATTVLKGKPLHAFLIEQGYLRLMLPKEVQLPKTVAAPKSKAKTKTAKKTGGKKKVVKSAALGPETSEINQTIEYEGVLTRETLGEIVELNSPELIKKGLPVRPFYIVVDRMAFSQEDRGRLVDSLTQAYDLNRSLYGEMAPRGATVLTVEGFRLNLSEEAQCPVCSYRAPILTSRHFSFNSPVGACPTCKGFGNILKLDRKKVIPNPTLSLERGALHPFTMPSAAGDRREMLQFCRKNKIPIDMPWEDLPEATRNLLWKGGKGFMGVEGLFDYLEEKKYKMHVRVFIARYRGGVLCEDCQGSRLRKETRFHLVQGKNIQALTALTIGQLKEFFEELQLSPTQMEICREVFKQLRSRLDYLVRVGVQYLGVNRETRTLSGGEYQRIMLANQLGVGLSQTLYVLDEPTIGLHPRDNDRLISIIQDLKELGNTIVIVEHDHDVIDSAENIIEMGPGSGFAGGEVVYAGAREDFYNAAGSLTAPYLKGSEFVKAVPTTRPVSMENYKFKVTLEGASGHNLKDLTVDFPLNRLVVVTGVSGSGKSTLITKTLYPALARALKIEFGPAQPYDKIEGFDHLKNVVLIDQQAIGKSARSSPISYMKAFDAIRELMASQPEAKAEKMTAGNFSLNVEGGRCPECRGTGYEEIDMMFMDNVIIPCDVCDGKRFQKDILEIRFQDKNIHEILTMTVSEAMQFFVNFPSLRKSLSLLKEVGLDYLQLGQPAGTLSGGESQRLKIAKELSQVHQKATLYILDEPTTGLHFREVELLMAVLNKLIEAGGSVLVVEHNLDVIKGADYLIDMGPEAGFEGGQVVATGTPAQVAEVKESLTGQYLKKYLANAAP